jgi:S-adenosyl-L-methionine hydrolase (adenosine-forming)
MNRIVTLLTDFGLADPWIGAVKGVLYSEWARWPESGPCPRIVDLSHDVPAGDIEAAAWFLQYVVSEFPPGTIHLAVVDPGVGGSRPALAIADEGQFFVGPGNGIFHWLTSRKDHGSGAQDSGLQVVQLDQTLNNRPGHFSGVSDTFHGRDVFAPAAARLAMSVPLDQVGSPVGCEALGTIPGQGFPPGSGGRGRRYRIRWIDRFGNAISDLKRDSETGRGLDGGRDVEVAGLRIPGPMESYVHGEPGAPFWYWGSGGTLEIALRDASAAATLGLHRGLALHVPGM